MPKKWNGQYTAGNTTIKHCGPFPHPAATAAAAAGAYGIRFVQGGFVVLPFTHLLICEHISKITHRLTTEPKTGPPPDHLVTLFSNLQEQTSILFFFLNCRYCYPQSHSTSLNMLCTVTQRKKGLFKQLKNICTFATSRRKTCTILQSQCACTKQLRLHSVAAELGVTGLMMRVSSIGTGGGTYRSSLRSRSSKSSVSRGQR